MLPQPLRTGKKLPNLVSYDAHRLQYKIYAYIHLDIGLFCQHPFAPR